MHIFFLYNSTVKNVAFLWKITRTFPFPSFFPLQSGIFIVYLRWLHMNIVQHSCLMEERVCLKKIKRGDPMDNDFHSWIMNWIGFFEWNNSSQVRGRKGDDIPSPRPSQDQTQILFKVFVLVNNEWDLFLTSQCNLSLRHQKIEQMNPWIMQFISFLDFFIRKKHLLEGNGRRDPFVFVSVNTFFFRFLIITMITSELILLILY